MPFDERGFSAQFVSHLAQLRNDIQVFKALPPDERKKVLKRTLNSLIDVPNMPEFVEGLLFSFGVEYLEHFFKSKFGEKDEA